MNEKIVGVNLGGWLVLEKWMTPHLFDNTVADDEYYLAHDLHKDTFTNLIKTHRHEFITSRDLSMIKAQGFNTLRVPVPYFIFGDVEPFVGCIENLDWLMVEAKYYGLKVLIDLHTVPLSQNGFDNGGISGVCRWSQDQNSINFTYSVLERLATRYKDSEALLGIELLNEPITEKMWQAMDVPNRYKARDEELALGSKPNSIEFIKDFYKEGIERLRHILKDEIAIMIHDAFEIDKWEEFYDQSKYKNLILDTHQYIMVLEANGCKHDLDSYLKAIDENFTKPIAEISKHIDVVCGEWCLFNSLCAGHDTKAGLAQFDKEQNLEENLLDEKELRATYQALCKAQLQAFNQSLGYFYWNYKLLLDEVKNPCFKGWSSWDLGVCLAHKWFNL